MRLFITGKWAMTCEMRFIDCKILKIRRQKYDRKRYMKCSWILNAVCKHVNTHWMATKIHLCIYERLTSKNILSICSNWQRLNGVRTTESQRKLTRHYCTFIQHDLNKSFELICGTHTRMRQAGSQYFFWRLVISSKNRISSPILSQFNPMFSIFCAISWKLKARKKTTRRIHIHMTE